MRSIAEFGNEILADIATSPDDRVRTVNPEIVRRIAADLLARRTAAHIWVLTSENKVLGVYISEVHATEAKANISGSQLSQLSLMELK